MSLEAAEPQDVAAGADISPSDWGDLNRLMARESLISYIRLVAPWFRIEEIHCVIAAHLEALARGDVDRLMVFMPPRTGKSSMTSVFLPSWYIGKHSNEQILQVGHKIDLPKGFSQEVKGIISLPQYKMIFPNVRMAKDSHAAGRWKVEDFSEYFNHDKKKGVRQQGKYNAAGVGTGIAGIGFNLGIVDDPMDEQDKDSKTAKDKIWNWWGPGFYTRRQPEKNAIIVTATRWATDDLPGRLLDLQKQGGDEWTVLNIPAILDKDSARKIYDMATGYGDLQLEPMKLKAGDSFAPRRFTLKELRRSRANMAARDWLALYMGTPVEDEGQILKKKWWRQWEEAEPPKCEFVFQVYDTAFEAKQDSDYSACTTWGVFKRTEKHKYFDEEVESYHCMLLGAWKERVQAADLRDKVLELWKKFEHPDRILIENKASGIQLVQELRRIRNPAIPVWPWTPPRGLRSELSKRARAFMASLVLEQGAVWYMPRIWAEEVINECAKCRFDGSDEHDDLPDTVAHALLYMRQTYRLDLPTDYDREREAIRGLPKRRPRLYG